MRFYRLLARIFPRAFRRQYADELEAAAADLLRAEGAKGPLHLVRLWIGLCADVVTRGLAERRAEQGNRHLLRAIGSEWRQAVRAVASRPGFAAVVVGLLGLAMAANAAVFGVVNATLLRPLPFAEPERLVLLWESYAPMHLDEMPWSDLDYVSVRSASAFASTSVFRWRRLVLTGQGAPATLRAGVVEGNVFDLLGTTAARGRAFTPSDSVAGPADIVVLSHAAWITRFDADPAIVGRTVTLDNAPYTVLGVLRPGVSFPPPITFSGQMLSPEPDIYLPYVLKTAADSRGAHSSFVVARLRPGVDLRGAGTEVAAIGERLAREFPDTNTDVHMRVEPLHGQSVVTIRGVLYVLLGAVAGVLLIACASIANLMLARASGRAREMALRTALGAGRASLVRQLLFESAIFGAGGTAVGLVGARWMSAGLVALNPIELPGMFRSSLDWRVFGFTILMTLAAVFAFGMLPALTGSRTDLVSMLRSGTRTTSSRRERRTKATLVVLQVSLAVVLLVGGGLMIRSLMRLWQVDPGFRSENVITTAVSLPAGRYGDAASQRGFQERWLARVRQVPGVSASAAMTMLPFAFDKSSSDYSIVGAPARKTGDYLIATYDYVSADFTTVLRMPVIEGRTLRDADGAAAPRVAIISESLARRHWPPGGAVGHQLLFGSKNDPPKTIVGVVRDVRMGGFDAGIDPTIYVPLSQSPVPAFWTAMVSERPADAVAADVRAALHDVDASLPADKVRPLTDIMGDTVKKPRFTAVVMSAFALTALLIAAVGLYGVLAFDVAEQRRELGVRIALGATPQGIRALVLGRGFRLVATGLVTGAVVSVASTRLISGLLFDAPGVDAIPLLAATIALALAAIVATWLPARRATRADPIEALRAQ